MPVTLDRIQSWLNEWAPPETAEAWDNPGLLVRAGDASAPVTGAVCALDVTPDTIEFAKAHGCSLIVSHHPVIFHALKALDGRDAAAAALAAGVSVLSAHTNLDKARGGVCETLAVALGLSDIRPEGAFCYVGRLTQLLPLCDFARAAARSLGAHVQYTAGLAHKPVQTVAAVSGAGGDLWADAVAAGADCLLTGEAGHHDYLDAAARGLPIVAAGHWATERMIAGELAQRLGRAFPALAVYAFEGREPVAFAAPQA